LSVKWLTISLSILKERVVVDLQVSIMMTLSISIVRVVLWSALVMFINGVEKALHVNECNDDSLFGAAESRLARTKILTDAHLRLLCPIKNGRQH
jgi:hypothetical protein